jgi:hypothetical protein
MPVKRKFLIIAVIAILTLGAVPTLALAAGEDLPVCDAFSVSVEFQRVNDQVSNVSFEWVGYAAPGYELKIFYAGDLIHQEIVYAAGVLLPVSILEFEGNGIGDYEFYVLALDGAPVCRSAVGSFYLDSIYVPPAPEDDAPVIDDGGDEFPTDGDLAPGGDNGGGSGPGWNPSLIFGSSPWTPSDLGPGGGGGGGSGPGWPGL